MFIRMNVNFTATNFNNLKDKLKPIFSVLAITRITTLPLPVDLCYLQITFANSLDPGQDRQNVIPDLDTNLLTP